MNVLIDTNIYLNYFRMSSEDIDSLEELLKILKKKKKLKLLLPEQIKQEYLRNRNSIINETKSKLEQQKNLKLNIPPVIRDWPETQKIKDSFKKFKFSYGEIIKKYNKELKAEKSKVDQVINNIFKKAIIIPETKNIINKAFYRMLKGNPPGKKDSFGDAIIWESILKRWTNDNLSIITADKDWVESDDKDTLNVFLLKEWKKRSRRKIKAYSSLGKFINDFEKKPMIKKETIKKEEMLRDMIIHSASDITLRSLAGTAVAFPVSGSAFQISDMLVARKRYHCPFCKIDLTAELENEYPDLCDYHGIAVRNTLSIITSGKERIFTCPYCDKKFNIDNLY